MGSGITVTIGHSIGDYAFGSYGKWQTCNYGSTTPEGIGTKTDFDTANAIDGITLPTTAQFETLINNCSWTQLSIYGQLGKVAHPNSGFLFLPIGWSTISVGQYWTSTTNIDDVAVLADYLAD